VFSLFGRRTKLKHKSSICQNSQVSKQKREKGPEMIKQRLSLGGKKMRKKVRALQRRGIKNGTALAIEKCTRNPRQLQFPLSPTTQLILPPTIHMIKVDCQGPNTA